MNLVADTTNRLLDFKRSPVLGGMKKTGKFLKDKALPVVASTGIGLGTVFTPQALHAEEPSLIAANNIPTSISSTREFNVDQYKAAYYKVGLNPNEEKDRVIFEFVERGLLPYKKEAIKDFKERTRNMPAYKQGSQYTDLYGILNGISNVSGDNVPKYIRMQPGDEKLFVNSADPLLARQIISAWGGGVDKNNPGHRKHGLTRDEAIDLIKKVNNNQFSSTSNFADELLSLRISSMEKRGLSDLVEIFTKHRESTLKYIEEDVKNSFLALN